MANANKPLVIYCPTCHTPIIQIESAGIPRMQEKDQVMLVNYAIVEHAMRHVEQAAETRYVFCPVNEVNIQVEQSWIKIMDVLVNKLHMQPEYVRDVMEEASGRKLAAVAVTVKKATKQTIKMEEVKLNPEEVKRRIRERAEAAGLEVVDDSKVAVGTEPQVT